MKKHNTEIENKIVDSEAFKIINHQIDRAVSELRMNIGIVKDKVSHVPKYAQTLGVRISYEVEIPNQEIEIEFDISNINSMIDTMIEIKNLRQQIGDLQRLKLRLINDYDFTHGDDSEQKEIFGDLTK